MTHLAFYLVSVLLISFSAGQESQINKTSLFLSYITTKTAKGTGFVASGAIPLIDWALEQINNSSTILPGYHLGYKTVEDSQVHLHKSPKCTTQLYKCCLSTCLDFVDNGLFLLTRCH